MSWLELASYWHEIQTSASGGTGTSSPGQVLVNIAGSVAGDAGLTYDAATGTLTTGAISTNVVVSPSVVYSTIFNVFSGGLVKFSDGVVYPLSLSLSSPGVLAVGNGAAGDTSGTVKLTSTQYVTGSRPTADAASRGMVWFVAGGTGVPDTFEICVKTTADTYAWVPLATIP